MLRLLKIDLLKLVNYRTFWVMSALYALLILSIPTSVMEFLKWLNEKGAELFDGNVDLMKIPVLYFPDIWHNITYVFIFLKVFLAILIIITVSNEFSYKTIRQNVIDGLSRLDFIKSKLLMILVLCLGSTLLVFLTGLFTGLIYTPDVNLSDVFYGIEFLFAYFLDILAYSIFAFLLTVVIKRSGLTIALLVLSMPIEYTITANLPEVLNGIVQYFPLHAINNLIEVPFPKYVFMEIQDSVSMTYVGVVMLYIALFVYAIYAKLQKSDV